MCVLKVGGGRGGAVGLMMGWGCGECGCVCVEGGLGGGVGCGRSDDGVGVR